MLTIQLIFEAGKSCSLVFIILRHFIGEYVIVAVFENYLSLGQGAFCLFVEGYFVGSKSLSRMSDFDRSAEIKKVVLATNHAIGFDYRLGRAGIGRSDEYEAWSLTHAPVSVGRMRAV